MGDVFDHGPIHNQRSYGQMETKVGFSASNRSIYTLHRESNCSWWTQMGSRDQKNTKIRDNFDHGSTTNGTMAKQRPQLYSAHRIGLSTLFTGILIVVVGRQS